MVKRRDLGIVAPHWLVVSPRTIAPRRVVADGLIIDRVFNLIHRIAAAFLLMAALAPCLVSASDPLTATHKQTRTITPGVEGKDSRLNTFCLGPDQNLWMCCRSLDGGSGSILVYTPEGSRLKTIDLEFTPQAINFSPEGPLFVAGGGKIARLSANGDVEVLVDAPNIGNREQMIAEMKQQAELQRKESLEAFRSQVEKLREQLEKLKQVPEGESDKLRVRRERRLKLLEASLEQMQDPFRDTDDRIVVNDSMLERIASSTGIAVSKRDVFVSCPKSKGYGYAVWRLSHELKDPQLIVSDISGCCGQLDIQTDGEHLIIAENTRFEVGYYDRDGKRLAGWGKRSRDSDEGFGSCCNPMNIRCCSNGDVLTAESSIGHIKRYRSDGTFVSLIGTARIGGGCKHVAIAFDSERNWHYMMNNDKSAVAVLIPKEQAPAETEDERLSREAVATHGKFLFGTWELDLPNAESGNLPKENQAVSMQDFIASNFGHLEFAPNGSVVKGPKEMKSGKGPAQAEAQSLFGTLLSSLTGSSEQASQLLSVGQSKWHAIQSIDGKLQLLTIDDGVPGFGATIEFRRGNEAMFSFFFSDPSSPSVGTFMYKRTSLEACGRDCSSVCEQK